MLWKTIEAKYKEGFDEAILIQKHRLTGDVRKKTVDVE